MARALLLLALAFTVAAHEHKNDEHEKAEHEEKSHLACIDTPEKLWLPSSLRAASNIHYRNIQLIQHVICVCGNNRV